MRLTLFVEAEVRVKTKHQEESKPNSLYKCKVLEMIMTVYWYLEPQMYLGNWIQQSEEDLKREFISLFLIYMLDQLNSRLDLVKHQTTYQKKTFKN